MNLDLIKQSQQRVEQVEAADFAAGVSRRDVERSMTDHIGIKLDAMYQ